MYMEALIAILATVQPIEALHNLIVFTKPWDFDRFDFLHLQEATELPKKPCTTKNLLFFFYFDQTFTHGDE